MDLDDRLPGANLPWLIGVLDTSVHMFVRRRQPRGTICEVRVYAAVSPEIGRMLILALGGRYAHKRWEATTKVEKRRVLDMLATMSRIEDVQDRARAAAGVLLTMGKGPRVAASAHKVREEMATRLMQRRYGDDASDVDSPATE